MKRVGLFGAVLSTAVSLLAANAANATALNGTFNVTIYQGVCSSCDINDADEQAQQGNPLITPSNQISTGVYTGALDWESGGNGDGNIGTFMTSSGGSYTDLSTVNNYSLSSAPFDLTTVFVITGNVTGSIGGDIQHDDGMSLYDGPGFANDIAGSALPTAEIPTAYTGLHGPFEIVYVEANGLPADLVMNVTTVPEPLTLSLFGAALAGAAASRRRRKANKSA